MPDIALIARFLSFATGIACLGVLVVEAPRDKLARAFLPFYLALSILVVGGLILAYANANPQSSIQRLGPAVDYLEAFIGRYGLMLTMPLCVHRLFGTTDRSRDAKIAAIVLAAFFVQHWTEFGASKVWDQRGDVAEDFLFAGVFVYSAWFVFSNLDRRTLDRKTSLVLTLGLLLAVPGVAHDLFLADLTNLSLYPLWYPLLSIAATWMIVRHANDSPEAELSAQWHLSSRENEVFQLAKQGLANKEIAQELGISPNTVKTHLRSIFDKSGARSRFDLIASSSQTSAKRG